MPKKKKKKKILEKAQRYSRDIHSKKLPAESGGLIDSRLREKCARRLRWRDPVCLRTVVHASGSFSFASGRHDLHVLQESGKETVSVV